MIRQPQQVAFFNVVIKIKKGQSFQTGLNYKINFLSAITKLCKVQIQPD